MANETVIRSTFREILLSVRNRLVTFLDIPEERVLIVARPDVKDYQADQYLQLKPGNSRVVDSWSDGSGRVSLYIERELYIILRTRLALDEANQSLLWLTEQSEGHFILEDKIIDGLHLYKPEDGALDVLTVEPIHYTGTSTPTMETDTPNWGVSTLSFTVSYQQLVNQSDQ